MAYFRDVVSIPDLPGIVATLRDVLTEKEFKTYSKRALSKGGRLMAASVKSMVAAKTGRARLGKIKFKSSSGAFKKSIRFVYRQGKDLKPYVVVGADKKTAVQFGSTKKGKPRWRIPAWYAHLVESGFTAVGRTKGQKGRANEKWGPRSIKSGKFDQTINDLIHKATREKALLYKARYLAAKRTKVIGKHIFRQSQKASQAAAVTAIVEGLALHAPQALERAKIEIMKRIKKAVYGKGR